MALVVGDKIFDYETVEEGMVEFIDTIIDCGVVLVISEKSNGLLKHLMSKSYRVDIMTPGDEMEFIKKRARCVFIAVNKIGASAYKLKTYCEDNMIPSQLFVLGNSMSKARYV